MSDKLQLQIRITVCFRYVILCAHPCMYRAHMDILHIEWLLYYRRHSFCGLELYERFNLRTVAPDTHHHVILWYSIVCILQHRQKNKGACNSLHSNWLHCYPGWFSCVKSNKTVTFSKLWSRTYISIWCTTTHNKTRVAYGYTTYQMTDLYTANVALFYKNKVG